MVAMVYDTCADAFCKECNGHYVLMFNHCDMMAFCNGKNVQSALPYLSPGERELLLSGICYSCFQKMFPPEVDSDD